MLYCDFNTGRSLCSYEAHIFISTQNKTVASAKAQLTLDSMFTQGMQMINQQER